METSPEVCTAMHQHAYQLRDKASTEPYAMAAVIGGFEGTHGFAIGYRRDAFQCELAQLMMRHDVQYVVAVHADVGKTADDGIDHRASAFASEVG